MILKSLRIKNVKCYEKGEIQFVPGKNVIIGRNGSGKSTILQSILYSLTGLYREGTNSQLVRNGEQIARFRLQFTQNGKEYLATRKLRTNSTTEASLTNMTSNILVADTQTRVTEEILRTTRAKKEVLQDVILVRQGEIAEIIDVQPQKRKKLFDKLLGIYDYELAHERCARIESVLEERKAQKESLIRGQKEIADKLAKRTSVLQELKSTTRRKKRELRDLRKKLKPLEKRRKALDKLGDKAKELSVSISRRKELLESQKAKAKEYKEEISSQRECIDGPIPKRYELEDVSNLEERTISNLESVEHNLATSNGELKELIEESSELEGLLGKSAVLQAQITEITKQIDDETKYIIENLPDIHTLPQDQWPQFASETIKSARSVRTEIRKSLKKTASLLERTRSIAEILKNLREQKRSLVRRIGENSTEATDVGGPNWRAISEESAGVLRTELDEIVQLEGTARKLHEQLISKASKAEKQVDYHRSQLDDLSTLMGKRCPKCKQIVDDAHARKLAEEINAEIHIQQESLTQLKKETKEKKTQVDELIKKTISHRSRIGLIRRLQNFLQNEGQLSRDLKEIKDNIKKKSERLRLLKLELKQLKSKTLGKRERTTDSWIDLLNEIKLKIKAFGDSETKLTETREKLETLSPKILELQSKNLRSEIEVLDKRIVSSEQRKSSLIALVEKVRAMKELLVSIDGIEEKIRIEKNEMNKLENQYDSHEHAAVVEELQSARESEISLSTEVRILTRDRIPQAKESFEESRNASQSIEEYRLEHQKTTEALAVVNKLREFYREIQRPLRHRDIVRASNHASFLFKSLISSNEFGRILITDDYELLVSRFDKLEPLSTLSGGEQILACLAIRIGFARALASSDLIILDEPTAFLDDQCKTELIDTLYRANPAKQMLIVTHDDEFEKVADRVIYIEKDATSHLSRIRW